MTRYLMFLAIGLYLLYMLVFYWRVIAGETLFVSATNWFLLMKGLMVIGTIFIIDIDNNDEVRWLIILLAGLTSFVIGAYFANTHFSFNPKNEIRAFKSKTVILDLSSAEFNQLVIGMGLVSVTIGILFAMAVGYNVLVQAIQLIVAGESQDTIRLQYSLLRTGISYTSDRYVAPGYARQFTATLLPLVVYLYYFRKFRVETDQSVMKYLYLLLFVSVGAYLLTLTGARSLVVEPVLLFLFLGSNLGPFPKQYRIPKKIMLYLIFSLSAFYVTVSAIMGRTSKADVSSAVEELWGRLVIGKAIVQMEIMKYLSVRPVVWGQNWYAGLMDVLPGHRLGLSNELHGLIFGSTRGSIGLSFWNSSWYNWGPMGVVIVAFLVGIFLQAYTIKYVRGPKTLSRIVIMFVAGYYLGNFHHPQSLLLNGFFTAMLYYLIIVIGKEVFRKTKESNQLMNYDDLTAIHSGNHN